MNPMNPTSPVKLRVEDYLAVEVVGRILPPDLLPRLAASEKDLPGLRAEDYHLTAGERLGQAANRRWQRLLGVYRAFRERFAELSETDSATTLTREYWLLPVLEEFGFGRVPFVGGGLHVGDRAFPVSHRWQHVPVHLLGWHANLDRPTSRGESGRAPQSMMQHLLNSGDAYGWGILSNGRQLRLLRDSTALVGSSYIQFDLEKIFDGDLFDEFLVLFVLTHASRFELVPRKAGADATLADCWLERWRQLSIAEGDRARDRLRDGVEEALNVLGTGFLEANPLLREAVTVGSLPLADFHHELLRLAYQLIFLFVAEDRDALLDPEASPEAMHRYQRFFSTRRLRDIADRRAGDLHADLWRTLVLVLDALGTDGGRPELGIPALGIPALGGLFFQAGKLDGNGGSEPDLLRRCELRNTRLLEAARLLATFRDRHGTRRSVDFRHLGSEELGSVYESLLELVPKVEPGPTFRLAPVAGNTRKTTGSYYTPASLIDVLLETTLDPVLDEAVASRDPQALLDLTVCDPACGSGHFLVAAARRIAKRYAQMYHGDEEPTPEHLQEALNKVVARCVYGVDVSPLAAELAKVSLWLESLQKGRPLAFLDGHVKVGNSLLGATPKLLADGVPDAAYNPTEGDDKKLAAGLRKQNAKDQESQLELDLFPVPFVRVGNTDLAGWAGKIAASPTRTLADVREQTRRFREFENSPELRLRRRVADAWCAAFMWRKHKGAPDAITSATLRRIEAGAQLAADVEAELATLTDTYRFFHWHLEFPGVFLVDNDTEHPDYDPRTGWRGGFSCVLGNPPWERVKLQEQEFFAARDAGIANARNAAERKNMIKQLEVSSDAAHHALFDEFRAELRRSAGWSHFLRSSGRYPLTGRGDVNTYAVFAETARTMISPTGRGGLVLPTGIATDLTTSHFFGDLVRKARLASFLEFENEEFLLSPDVHHSFRFCLLSVSGEARPIEAAQFAFGVRRIADLDERRMMMPPGDLLQVNPNTGTAPLFRSRRDAEITLGVYRRFPVLVRDTPVRNPWSVSFMAMFHMANDSGKFRRTDELEAAGWNLEGNTFVRGSDRMLPLYEAKMVHHFDHRYGTYEGQTEAQANMGTLPRLTSEQKADPNRAVLPRYWVNEKEVDERLDGRWDKGWLLGWRDICRSTDERTLISSIVPRAAVGDKFLLMLPVDRGWLLQAVTSSMVFDYAARQKSAGTSFKYFLIKQLPVLPPSRFDEPADWDAKTSVANWVECRLLELDYTSWDIEAFARDLGDDGPPFVWDDRRRFVLRAELDAAFFHLYGIERDDVGYIIERFGAFRRNDPERFERTKELILEVYDAMATAAEKGEPYRPLLDPPPGCGPRHPDRRE